MSDLISKMAQRLVVGHKRDGRSIYDAQAKRELILASREPGVSLAKLARDCGVNANQLNSWVRQYERELAKTVASNSEVVEVQTPPFVAVNIEEAQKEEVTTVDLQARLPNGVVVDLRGCGMQQTRGRTGLGDGSVCRGVVRFWKSAA